MMVTRARDPGPFVREIEHTADLGLEVEAPSLPLLFERAGLGMLALMIDLAAVEPREQVANVAHLPGIVGHALAMPDIHWGYGFPIGGVAAVDAEEGAISPGGIGFDINCGVRLLRTALAADDLTPHLGRIADALYQAI